MLANASVHLCGKQVCKKSQTVVHVYVMERHLIIQEGYLLETLNTWQLIILSKQSFIISLVALQLE